MNISTHNSPLATPAPPQTVQLDTFVNYNNVHIICRPIDRISDSLDPFHLANHPGQKPSSSPTQDLHYAVNTLHEVQRNLYPTFTPTQITLVTTYQTLLTSVARYLSTVENLPLPIPTPIRHRFSHPAHNEPGSQPE